MNKLDKRPAFPTYNSVLEHRKGPTNREKLAMDIFVSIVAIYDTEEGITKCANRSLKAADLFFEELDKNA